MFSKVFRALAIVGLILPTSMPMANAAPIQVITGTITQTDGTPVSAGEVELVSPQIKDKVVVSNSGAFKVRAKPGKAVFTYRYITKQPDANWNEYIWTVSTFGFTVDSQTTTLSVTVPVIQDWRVKTVDSRGNAVGGVFLQVWGFSSDEIAQAVPGFTTGPRSSGNRAACYVTMSNSGTATCPFFQGISLSLTAPTSNCGVEPIDFTLATCNIGNLIYKPEPDLTLKYPLYLSQVGPSQTTVVLDDVPTLALAAPASVVAGTSASIGVNAQAPLASNAAAEIRNRANSWTGKNVSLFRRDFINAKKPGKWVKVQTLKLNSKRAARFKVAVPRTSQFKVVSSEFSAGSAVVTIKTKSR